MKPAVLNRPEFPSFIERAKVPTLFRMFRNAATLAHLAHVGKGPPYVLIGGKAWYDIADIKFWLERHKTCGPSDKEAPSKSLLASTSAKKRGRPSKLEQYRREIENARKSAR